MDALITLKKTIKISPIRYYKGLTKITFNFGSISYEDKDIIKLNTDLEDDLKELEIIPDLKELEIIPDKKKKKTKKKATKKTK